MIQYTKFPAAGAFVLLLTSLSLQADLYVDPANGGDQNSGSLEAPFRSLEAARDAMRKISRDSHTDSIIYLRGGIYPVTGTIRFDERDSGSNGRKIIYRAFPGETPVFDAGVKITGWQADAGGVWKASGIKTDIIRQIYVNGVRANRARSESMTSGVGWPQPYTSSTDLNWELKKEFYPDGIELPRTSISPDWANPQDIELVWIGEQSKCTWRSHRVLVDELTEGKPDTTIVKLANYGHVMTGSLMSRPLPENPFHVENARELLDRPGEWYHNRKTKELFYMPRPGEDMTTAEIIVPSGLETLISIEGSTLDAKVTDLVFDGWVFRHTAWNRPSSSRLGACCNQADKYIKSFGNIGRAKKAIHRKEFYFDPAFDYVVDDDGDAEGFKPDACIELNAAERITIVNCRLEKLGGAGIDLNQGCNHIEITGNLIRDVSATGIMIGRWDQDHVGEGEEVCKEGRIGNNLITKIGQEYYNSIAITAYISDGLTISHNDLIDLPYSGISSGWGSWKGRGAWLTTNRRNVIENNLIRDIGKLCSDGGGIYTIGIGKSRIDPDTLTSKIRGNYIAEIGLSYGALYPDEGSCYYEISGNVCENVETSEKGKWLHLWSPDHHSITVDGNFSNSPKFINKGILCPLTRHTVYQGENRPEAAVEIINRAGLQPAFSYLKHVR